MDPGRAKRTADVFRNQRPTLTIERTSVIHPRPCYEVVTYRVTSTTKLASATLKSLFAAGLLGLGQDFRIKSPVDGAEVPAGADEVPCVTVDITTDRIVRSPAIDPRTGKAYSCIKHPYFVYECETCCDSGD